MITDGISKRILVRNTKFPQVLVMDWNILASFCPESHSFCVENISLREWSSPLTQYFMFNYTYDRYILCSSTKVLLLIMSNHSWKAVVKKDFKGKGVSSLFADFWQCSRKGMVVICLTWSVLAWGSHFIADRKKPQKADVNGLVRWLWYVWTGTQAYFLLQSFRSPSFLLL